MLAPGQIPSYLVGKRLIDEDAVATGDLKIVDASRRHRVHVVIRAGGPGLVLKQAELAHAAGLAHEAVVLDALRRHGADCGLDRFLPVVLAHDPRRRLLVLELAHGAEDLLQYNARGRFAVTPARALGRGAALLHALSADAIGAPPDAEPEWSLAVHRPRLEMLSSLSWASMELIRLVQASEELCERLDELRGAWRASAVIHGDLRWENCLAVARAGATRKTRILVIDWEAAGGGDPAFDVAAVLADHLDAWVQSIPFTATDEPARLVRQARMPLRRMRPALRAFWAAYLDATRTTAAARRAILRKAVAFTAPRLLQLALERAQRQPGLSRDIVTEVQLALNVIRSPDRAANRLLGLS